MTMTAIGGSVYDGQNATRFAYSLARAFIEFFAAQISIDHRQLKPEFPRPGVFVLTGVGENRSGELLIPESISHRVEILHIGSRLNEECHEFIVRDMLILRKDIVDAGYPLPVHGCAPAGNGRFLNYDVRRDALLCSIPEFKKIVAQSAGVLKALAEAFAAGYSVELELDDAPVKIPTASDRWYKHGRGKGHSVTSTGLITGIFPEMNLIEIVIEGLKSNRVQQATPSTAVMLELMKWGVPCRGYVTYSIASPIFPFGTDTGKITIEKLWEVTSQPSLDLS